MVRAYKNSTESVNLTDLNDESECEFIVLTDESECELQYALFGI